MRWPMYFATKSVTTTRGPIEAGEAFPLQSKGYIIGMGATFGCPNARAMRFADLPYVAIVDVGSEEQAKRVREQRMTLRDAQKLIKPKPVAAA